MPVAVWPNSPSLPGPAHRPRMRRGGSDRSRGAPSTPRSPAHCWSRCGNGPATRAGSISPRRCLLCSTRRSATVRSCLVAGDTAVRSVPNCSPSVRRRSIGTCAPSEPVTIASGECRRSGSPPPAWDSSTSPRARTRRNRASSSSTPSPTQGRPGRATACSPSAPPACTRGGCSLAASRTTPTVPPLTCSNGRSTRFRGSRSGSTRSS
jgi:hypothetical protein